MIRTLRSRVFRVLLRTLATNLGRAPRIVLFCSDVIARTAFAGMRELVVAEYLRIAGYDKLRATIAPPDPRVKTFQPPLIFGTFHLGALGAIGTMLGDLPANVLVLRATPKLARPQPNVTIEATRGDEQHRARVFHRALQYLQNKQFVFVTLDPEEATRIAAPFRGRTLQLARGPFALARITQTPIVPVIARWRNARVELVFGDAIDAMSDEAAIAARVALWLEKYLEENPEDESQRVRDLTM